MSSSLFFSRRKRPRLLEQLGRRELLGSALSSSQVFRNQMGDGWLDSAATPDLGPCPSPFYRKDLRGHYGCVNAIEFSNDGGRWIASGGDDRRILLWDVEKALDSKGSPAVMRGQHHSNIFCLAFDNSNTKIFSGGNDEQVIVHDVQSGETINIFLHQDALYGLSVDPLNDNVFASACDDGRVLIFDIRQPPSEDPFELARFDGNPMHAVVYNPLDSRLLATANAKQGITLWDIRKPKSALKFYGAKQESCMSVRFSSSGDRLLGLRRRLSPVLYEIHSELPAMQFYSDNYYNSCTMKSCSFAGSRDQYVLSGSDDFCLYMWKIPDEIPEDRWSRKADFVLSGHRSIVNQVRYNADSCIIISSGVEKIIKAWSPFRISNDNGTNAAVENPRQTYTHEDYVDLLVRNGPVMTHDYSNESLDEDPRMMAFFDSLVQREREVASSDDDDDGGVINSGSEVLLNNELSDSGGSSSTRSDFETSPFGLVLYPATPPRFDGGEICSSTVVAASSSSGSSSDSDRCSEDSLSSITSHSSRGRSSSSSSRGTSDNGGGGGGDAVQRSGASYSSPGLRNALAKVDGNSEVRNALGRFKRLRDSVADDSDSESGSSDVIRKKRRCSLRKKLSSAISNSEGEGSARNVICEERNGDRRTDNGAIALPLSARNGGNLLLSSRDGCSGCFNTDTCDLKTCNGITPKDDSCPSGYADGQTADGSRALSTDRDLLSDRKRIQNVAVSPAVELSGSTEINSAPSEQFRQIKNRDRIFRGKYRASERKRDDTDSETE